MLRSPSRFAVALGLFGFACLMVSTKLAAWQIGPLTIATASLPGAEAGIPYQVSLQAHGGVNPYTWQLAEGSHLPPGLRLHQHSGQITGTPTTAGEYRFTLTLSDVNAPPGRVQRDFTITVVAGLTIEWQQAPKVNGTSIAGSVIVANHTDQPASLTVIIVAVNQIGRATALGYQQFVIQPQAQQDIPFGSSPGPGSYQVRADAVAHFSASKINLRAHKQTGKGELVVQQI
ncbi:MAG: putative Ig domain-containing protein [Acetobacteraceae bacterium]|nr:putative Ig domain-containing protein [Acetobacteraceae bacterium]